MDEESLREIMKFFDEEAEIFLALCGEEDREFFSLPPRKRKPEDYARLSTVAAVLRLRGAVMKIIKTAETARRTNAVMKALEAEGKKYENICRWTEDFIVKIEDADLRRETEAMWRKKKADFEARGTRIEDIFF